MSSKMSRRSFLGKAAIGAAGFALGDVLGMATGKAEPAMRKEPEGAAAAAGDIVPFRGANQAGIVTPQPNCLNIAAFDVTTDKIGELKQLLQSWTTLIETMTQGRLLGGEGEPDPAFPPADTGEHIGLNPAKLTVTLGFGASLFEKDGADRFGLRSRQPKGLTPMAQFHGDSLKTELTHGDIVVQVCADDPVICFHVIRNLANAARGVAHLRWQQSGQLGVRGQGTKRNLFGFKDGTNNPQLNDDAFMQRNVWLQPGDAGDWAGGTFMVVRRIQMRIETWDQLTFGDQEDIIGRRKLSGSPMDGSREFEQPDFAGDSQGEKTPLDSHIRLSNPRTGEVSERERILRRGYNFMETLDSVGRINAGLLFICFNRSIQTQFESINKRLTNSKKPDAMLAYTQTTGGGYFFVPPGIQAGNHFLGDGLFR